MHCPIKAFIHLSSSLNYNILYGLTNDMKPKYVLYLAHNWLKSFLSVSLASHKPTLQSSTDGSAESSLAADGIYDDVTASGACANTQSEASVWWRVDLGKVYRIAAVEVTGCSDCTSMYDKCLFTLSGLHILGILLSVHLGQHVSVEGVIENVQWVPIRASVYLSNFRLATFQCKYLSD